MNSRNTALNRRAFIKTLSSLSLGGSAVMSQWAPTTAMATAAQPDAYRALVCVFMFGGMDHNEVVLPYDQTHYDDLRASRPDIFSAHATEMHGASRDRSNLLPLTPLDQIATEGRQYAVPRELAPLRTLFDAEELCFVGSVGPLIQPTTRSTYESGSVQLPPALFSHNDQQNYWQGLAPEGARFGWGGRFIDALNQQSKLGSTDDYALVSTAGNNLLLAGQDTQSFKIGADTVTGPRVESERWLLGNNNEMDSVRANLASHFRESFGADANLLNADFAEIRSNAMRRIDNFGAVFNNLSPFTTTFPNDGFGVQFQRVANAIRASKALGAKRQIYFIGVGGFDTHSNQAADITWRQQGLADSVLAFRNAMTEASSWNDVTVFSGADFGRTLVANGSGTDHGWAGHHFVTGGDVRGKRIIGKMPQYDPDGEEYTASRARLIPSVSIEQYSASLGRWLDVDNTTIQSVMPNLANFSTQDLDLFKL